MITVSGSDLHSGKGADDKIRSGDALREQIESPYFTVIYDGNILQTGNICREQ